MANVLKHRFTSAKSDGADATQVQPSHWNDGHGFIGGAAGDVLMRDLADPTFGAKWVPSGYKEIQNAQSGTLHDWTPAGFGTENTIIQWLGTSDTSITGLLGPGVLGQVVTIKNRVASRLYFFNTWAESSTPARFYNLVTSGPTVVALGGWIQFVWLSGWLIIGHEQGAWVTPAFNAGDYTASAGMTWGVTAGNVTQCGYRLSGRTLHWSMYLSTTTLGGTPGTALFRTIPGGFDAVAFTPVFASAFLQDGTQVALIGLHEPANRRIHLIRDAAQAQTFPLGSTHVYVSTMCEVV